VQGGAGDQADVAAGGADDDEFSIMWPPRTPAQAKRRAIAAVRRRAGLSEAEFYHRLFRQPES